MNRIIAIIALLLVMTGLAQAATKYGFSVGGKDVTSDNYNNITNSGVITIRSGGHLYYSPSSNTLYVKNATIWCTGSGKRGIYNESCVGLTIVFEGADTIYAKSGEALRVNKNTTITCRNGGTAFIEGESKNGLCPYSGSTVTVNDADLVVRGPESSAIEGSGSGSSGGSIVINNSTVKAYGKKAAVYNMKSVTVKGNSEVRLTMRTSAVTVQNVATFNVELPMAVTYPDNAFFDSKKKTLCSIDYPDGIKSTILILKDAIEINATNFPDPNFRSYVSNNFDNNGDGYLNSAERNCVNQIDVTGTSISTLKGIEHFKNLNWLICINCGLNSIDVSKNTALNALLCDKNNLKSLDVSKNTELMSFSCSTNGLKSLDVSKNTKLTHLQCFDNSDLKSLDLTNNQKLEVLLCYKCQLTSLNVSWNKALKQLHCYKNALNTLSLSTSNTALNDIRADMNKLRGQAMQTFVNNLPTVTNGKLIIFNFSESLTDGNQIFIDQVNTAKSRGWNVYQYYDPTGSALEYAGLDRGIEINSTNFPDDDFRSWVSSNCDADKNGYLSEMEAKARTVMEFERMGWWSLKGIEYFTELATLNCSNNSLTSLDVSKNTKLVALYCSNNKITSLNLTKNTALKTLDCSNNTLGSLDVSKNTALTKLYCASCGLNTLDVSKNTALTDLSCLGNNLTALNLTNNKALNTIQVHLNSIKGTNMDALVASLPKNNTTPLYKFYVYYKHSTEGNVFTKAQATAAKARGWQPYWYNGSAWTTYEGSSAGTTGDVNGDGNVNSADVQKVYALMAQGATGNNHPEADVNGDGNVNSADIQKIYSIMAGQN